MNYEKIYKDLMTKRKNSPPTGYFERHHIIPRCLGGTNEESNTVNLTGREHYIAHRLLVKFNPYPGLKAAFFIMCSTSKNRGNYTVPSKVYALSKEMLSGSMKGRIMAKETKAKISSSLMGRKFTNLHLKRMRKPKSDKGRENISKAKIGSLNPMFGTISPTRDIPHSKKTKDFISARTKIMTEYDPCPHCGKEANKGNLLRWHYDNCKYKD